VLRNGAHGVGYHEIFLLMVTVHYTVILDVL
jgi:hypothetical protein